MNKLNSQKVINHLKKSDQNYIKQYFQGGSCYDDEANECGDFSEKVFQNLLTKGLIKLVGRSEEFWSEGYYKLVGS